MVQVFKTNVQHPVWAGIISKALQKKYPGAIVNFDLEDEDRILRVESRYCNTASIIRCLQEYGQSCIFLPMDQE